VEIQKRSLRSSPESKDCTKKKVVQQRPESRNKKVYCTTQRKSKYWIKEFNGYIEIALATKNRNLAAEKKTLSLPGNHHFMSFAEFVTGMIQFNKENPDCGLSTEQKKCRRPSCQFTPLLYIFTCLTERRKTQGKGRCQLLFFISLPASQREDRLREREGR
jgi:hypothetical protein